MRCFLHGLSVVLLQQLAATVCVLSPLAVANAAGEANATESKAATEARAAANATVPDDESTFAAVLRVNARAVKDARSTSSLGAERQGSGVVIGRDGLVLTIGYLIVEAEEVTLTDRAGKVRPATVVGYDHASGLGLVRSLVPIDTTPVSFGDSKSLAEGATVRVVNYGGRDESTSAYVVSRRQFTGNWEYLLERAIFISPPTLNWSGAALLDANGRLLGVGSLIVRQVAADVPVPGNMFVPIDLLEPIRDDLVKHGRRAGPSRPWLGVAADEVQGRLFVTRVSPEGPADRAGVQAGDIILGVGADRVQSQAELYRRVWALGGAGVDVALRVLQEAEVKELTVRSIDRSEYFRPKPTL